jgi:hypothetical protein
MGIEIGIREVCRYLDKLNHTQKQKIEDVSFNYTRKILKGRLSAVF